MKKRNRRCDPQKQAYWEEVLRRWKESGQSVRGYCRAEGLRESAFFFWRRELARRSQTSRAVSTAGPSAVPADPSPKGQSSRHRGTPSFLPVRVVSPAREEQRGGLEIAWSNGRVLRVPPDFDRQTLADVLAVLEARPCKNRDKHGRGRIPDKIERKEETHDLTEAEKAALGGVANLVELPAEICSSLSQRRAKEND